MFRIDPPPPMDSFAQTELSATLYKWSKKALFKEVLSDKYTIFRVKAGVVDFYPHEYTKFMQSYCPKCMKVCMLLFVIHYNCLKLHWSYNRSYTCCTECKGNNPSPSLELQYHFLLLLKDLSGDNLITMVADDHAVHVVSACLLILLKLQHSHSLLGSGLFLVLLHIYSWPCHSFIFSE